MKFELFQDNRSEWRWRLIADNNVNVIADSGEGYKNRGDAEHGVNLVKSLRQDTVLYEKRSDGTWIKR